MSFTKILNHPDCQEIIAKLTSGDSSRDVADWLKNKYPDNKDHQVSYNSLNEFRKSHLNVHGAVLNDIRSKLADSVEQDAKEQLVKEVKKNKTYREKCEEVIDKEIDWRYRLMQFLNVVESLFEDHFNETQKNPENYKRQYVMQGWMTTIIQMVQEIRKMEGAPDQIVQHNVTIQTIEEQTALIQEALRQTFAEVDLETSLLLMDKYTQNLAKLKAQRESQISPEVAYKKINTVLDNVGMKLLPESKKDDNEGGNE